MKISKNTKAILSNFSRINNSINICPGNVLLTLSLDKAVYARAVIDEDVPHVMSIYSLSEFLKTLKLLNSDELEINENCCNIIDGDRSINYLWSPRDLIGVVPEQYPQHNVKGQILLTESMISDIKSASATMNLDRLTLSSDSENLVLKVHKQARQSSSKFEYALGKCPLGVPYELHVKTSNLFMINGDYQVELWSVIIPQKDNTTLYHSALQFKHTDIDISYLLSCSKDSTKLT